MTPGFPTMSADSVSNTVVIQVGTSATPAAPIGLSATWQPGQPAQVNLAWTDMSTNETHFVVQRCTGTNCTTFAALPGDRAGARRDGHRDLRRYDGRRA